jgi:hypothetical protein
MCITDKESRIKRERKRERDRELLCKTGERRLYFQRKRNTHFVQNSKKGMNRGEEKSRWSLRYIIWIYREEDKYISLTLYSFPSELFFPPRFNSRC